MHRPQLIVRLNELKALDVSSIDNRTYLFSNNEWLLTKFQLAAFTIDLPVFDHERPPLCFVQ